MSSFFNETKANNEHNSNNEPLPYGFVNSVWHKLKVNGNEVNCYSARCGKGIHSFAWVDIDTDGDFEITVDLSTTSSFIIIIIKC